MSDAKVLGLVEELEALLLAPDDQQDPSVLASWNDRFREAVARAERGPGWEAVLARAHAMAGPLTARVLRLKDAGAAIREELAATSQGQRALKGYSSPA